MYYAIQNDPLHSYSYPLYRLSGNKEEAKGLLSHLKLCLKLVVGLMTNIWASTQKLQVPGLKKHEIHIFYNTTPKSMLAHHGERREA